jgi:hypothetical protein
MGHPLGKAGVYSWILRFPVACLLFYLISGVSSKKLKIYKLGFGMELGIYGLDLEDWLKNE